MAIPKLMDDLAYISKLGNNPGIDNGLTPSEFRAKFDAAALALQKSLNEVIEVVNDNTSQPLLKTGGKMAGNIDMGGHKVTGLKAPTDDGDAVPKSWLENYINTQFLGGAW